MNTPFVNNCKALVNEFQTAFDTPKDRELWLKLIDEEAGEVLEAAQNLLKETCDLVYVMIGLSNMDKPDVDHIEVPPEVGHKLSFALQYVFAMQDLLPEGGFADAFNRVHLSNMSKLGEDGKPIRREDGKTLKGPNYKPPILEDLIY